MSGTLTATQQLEQMFGPPVTGGLGTPVGVQSIEEEAEAVYTAKVYRGVSVMPDIQYIAIPAARRVRATRCRSGWQLNVAF